MDCYAVVNNIPGTFHSKDLRRFFSHFIESRRFACFHYRHRPEVKSSKDSSQQAESVESHSKSQRNAGSCCCLVKFCSIENRSKFVSEYHQCHWTSINDVELSNRCFVSPIKVYPDSAPETADQTLLRESDLTHMLELTPPSVMPQGNVGTPTAHFVGLIDQCRLPPGVIKKLGLDFRKARTKGFSKMPFQYEKSLEDRYREVHNPPDPDEQKSDDDSKKGNDNDNDECEEWERHEAREDDVTTQDRTKPRLYEEELEVVWEKGGPGLVFYTDDYLWTERAGRDTDELWADDWDVDMSVYYDRSAGDKDARDHMLMREESQLAEGKLEQSVFAKKRKSHNSWRRGKKRCRSASPGFAEFETHTKGIGRKVLEKQGWRDGHGLGKSEIGIPYPVALDMKEDSQLGYVKRGLGYRGEAMQRYGLQKRPEKRTITTVFDPSGTIDKEDTPWRRNEPSVNKNRTVVFERRGGMFLKKN